MKYKKEILEHPNVRRYFSQIFSQIKGEDVEITVSSPFRKDRRPSLSINLVSGLWYDHATGEKGNIVDFEQRRSHCDCESAIRNLSHLSDVGVGNLTNSGAIESRGSKPDLPTYQQVEGWSEDLFGVSGKAIRAFLNHSRGFKDETLRAFKIGLHPSSGEICVPIFGKSGIEILHLKWIRYNLSTGSKSIRSVGKAALFGVDKLELPNDQAVEVIVTEGELDAMILVQAGFRAISGTAGALCWDPSWGEIVGGHHVVVCYDSDKTGRTGARKVVDSILDHALSVKNIDIFPNSTTKDRKDITDYIVKEKHTADDLRAIISASPPIDKRRIQNSHILEVLDATHELVEVCPAQDFVEGTLYYATKVNNMNYLVTSNMECFTFDESEKRGIELSRGHVDKFNYSAAGLRSYLQSESDPNPFDLFEEIASYLKQYVILKDPDCFEFLSLWLMGTYIFRVFKYYPYIHLVGEKQSGKTLLMDIMAPIAFNGELSSNSTEAVLFRDVQNNQPTLFLDEVENFRSKDNERYGAVMAILKTGFSKSGLVKRCGGKNRDEIHSFHTYSPKVLAGINELDDVLADRTIRIPMLRRLSSEPVEPYRGNKACEDRQGRMRDKLYSFGLAFGPQIAEIYQNSIHEIDGLDHLSNREYDIWSPIILLANCVDAASGEAHVMEKMVRLSKSVISEHRTSDIVENATTKLLVGLNAMVDELVPIATDGSLLTFDTDSAFEYFKTLEEFSWLENKTWLSRQMRNVGVAVGRKKIGRRTSGTYIVDRISLRDWTRRYVKEQDETVTVTPQEQVQT